MSRLRLTVDVEYEDNGNSVERLAANLRGAVFTAVDNGMLTEASDAEVKTYEMDVREVYEPEVSAGHPDKCVTHHLACDCREAMFAKLAEQNRLAIERMNQFERAAFDDKDEWDRIKKEAMFGKDLWEWIKSQGSDFCGEEVSEDILPIAEKAGLCKKVAYDPEKHGDIEMAEPGDLIWFWGEEKEVRMDHEMGKCPKCGGNLDYGCGEPSDDSQYFYYWKCTECHATGKEWYKMTFIEHTVNEQGES